MRAVVIAATIMLVGLASPASSATVRHGGADDQRLIASCIRQATQGRRWLGRTLSALRNQEAGWIGAEVPNRNGSHDLGPLQINSSWIPRIATLVHRHPAHVYRWLRDDACFNVGAARWIFLTDLSASGNYWKAVGMYHSPTTWRQLRYALAVADRLGQRSIIIPSVDNADGRQRDDGIADR